MKLFFGLLVTFLTTSTIAQAQSGLDLLGRKVGAVVLPAPSVALGDLGRLDKSSGEVEWMIELIAADLPMDLSFGSYVLERANGDRETIELTADEPKAYLTAAYKPGPFGVFTKDEQHYRTDGFELRAPDEISSMLLTRWPYYHDEEIIAVSRPGLTAEGRAEALEELRQIADRSYNEIVTLLDGKNLKELDRDVRFHTVSLTLRVLEPALDGLAAIGTLEDAEMLLTKAASLEEKGVTYAWRPLAKAAIVIEARLNTLATGRSAALFDQYMNGVDGDLYPFVVNELAAKGYRPALEALLYALPTDDFSPSFDEWDKSRAFSTLLRFGSPDLHDLSLKIVAAYREEKIRYLEGKERQPSSVHVQLDDAIDEALFYAATGQSTSPHALSFPIQVNSYYLMELAPALRDPSELLGFFLKSGREYNFSEMTEMVCQALSGRSPDPDLLDRIYNEFLQYAVWIDHIRPNWWASTALSSGMSNCHLEAGALDLVETTLFNGSEVFPLPWHFASQDLAIAAEQNLSLDIPFIYSRLFDPAPDQWVDTALRDVQSEPGVQNYLAYRRVATTSGYYDPGPYTGNAMRRMFMQPFKIDAADTWQVWALGLVDLRIQIEPESQSVLFGISVQATGHTEGELGAIIARDPEMIQANVEGGAIQMIKKVEFRNGTDAHPLEFVGTLSNGIHAYSGKTADISATDAVLDVFFETKDVDGEPTNAWTISFPLHHSPFAFESRVRFGEVSFQ